MLESGQFDRHAWFISEYPDPVWVKNVTSATCSSMEVLRYVFLKASSHNLLHSDIKNFVTWTIIHQSAEVFAFLGDFFVKHYVKKKCFVKEIGNEVHSHNNEYRICNAIKNLWYYVRTEEASKFQYTRKGPWMYGIVMYSAMVAKERILETLFDSGWESMLKDFAEAKEEGDVLKSEMQPADLGYLKSLKAAMSSFPQNRWNIFGKQDTNPRLYHPFPPPISINKMLMTLMRTNNLVGSKKNTQMIHELVKNGEFTVLLVVLKNRDERTSNLISSALRFMVHDSSIYRVDDVMVEFLMLRHNYLKVGVGRLIDELRENIFVERLWNYRHSVKYKNLKLKRIEFIYNEIITNRTTQDINWNMFCQNYMFGAYDDHQEALWLLFMDSSVRLEKGSELLETIDFVQMRSFLLIANQLPQEIRISLAFIISSINSMSNLEMGGEENKCIRRTKSVVALSDTSKRICDTRLPCRIPNKVYIKPEKIKNMINILAPFYSSPSLPKISSE